MRRTCLVLLALVASSMVLVACSGSGTALTEDQRERRAEEIMSGELSN